MRFNFFNRAFVLILLSCLIFQNAFSTTYISVASGDWNSDITWSGTGIPSTDDSVIIEGGVIVTVNSMDAICNVLDIGTGGLSAGSGTLLFTSGGELTVNGITTFGSSFNTGAIDMSNGGTFICGGWILNSPGSGVLLYGTGTVKFTSTFSLPNDLNLSKFYNLEIISGTTSLGGATTVYGNFAMSHTGVMDANGNEFTVQGNWTQSETASFTEGTGTVILNGTANQYINHTATETFNNLLINKPSGKLILSSGSISVTTLLTIISGIFDLGTNTLSGGGGLTMTNGELQIAQLTSVCNCTLPQLTGTYSISGGTITFKGVGDQVIRGETISTPMISEYFHIVFRGSGTKTLEGNLDVNGSLSILDDAELDVSVLNRSIFLAGDWINESTFTFPDAFNERNGSLIIDGMSTTNLTSATVADGETFYDLLMEKSSGENNLILNNKIQITHQLTLTTGHILTSPVSGTLTIETTAIAVAGGNNDSFIDGPVIKKTNSIAAYILPTGKITPNNEYRWIGITPSGNTATTYVAEYFYGIPSNNTDVGPGVNRVSELEKWILLRTAGTEDAKVELSWTVNSIVNTNTTDLLVVQDDGTPGPRWINKCTCITAGTTNEGSIQTTSDITLFGTTYPLSLGSPHPTNNELGSSRYSVAEGDWDDTTIWALRSGGPSGATIPTSMTRVIIEAGKRVNVNVMAEALKVTLGNNGNGVLDFNNTSNHLAVGDEGILINSGSDAEGTNISAVLGTTGSITLNSDVSTESSDNITASTFTFLRELKVGKISADSGIVTNFTNNTSTTLLGDLTIKQNFLGSGTLVNTGYLKLKGTDAEIGTNLIDAISFTPNTVEYDDTVTGFDFSEKNATYYNLILSGAGVKQPSVPWTINGNLTLNAGVILDQNTYANTIFIKGDWMASGASFLPSISSLAGVIFNGTTEQHITSGGNAFGNLMINNSSSTGIVLQDEMKIASGGKLTLTNGYVFLGNNNLVLLSGNVNPVNASPNSFIITNGTGTLGMEAITGSRLFPVGSQGAATEYTPVVIDNTGGLSDRYDVRVCNDIYSNGLCSGAIQIANQVINKTWNITEAVAGGSSVDLTLQWNASNELPGFNRNESFISHYTSNAWHQQQVAGLAGGNGPYIKTITNLTGTLSRFGVGSSGSPLPIELLEFKANQNANTVNIDWITASEKDNDYFIVERTTDGIVFNSIAKQKGAGNSTQIRYYTAIDQAPLSGTSYYRLKQVDFDGHSSFSDLVQINFNEANANTFNMYPNPCKGMVYLSFYDLPDKDIEIKIFDISGKMVYSRILEIKQIKENRFRLDFSNDLSPGVYIVSSNSRGQMSRQKLFIQ